MELLDDLLNRYTELIINFNRKLRETYPFEGTFYDNNVKKFPRKGNIDDLEYLFHGSGCSVYFKDGIELHYDLVPLFDNNYMKTGSWKFFKFVLTYCTVKKINFKLKEEDIKSYLDGLVELGKIKKGEFPYDGEYRIVEPSEQLYF